MPTLRLREDELDEIKTQQLWARVSAVSASNALDRLKRHRQKSFRHTWTIELKPQFLSDFDALDQTTREAVVAAVAVLANAKYPTRCGHPMNGHSLDSYEIGNGYRIVYQWDIMLHCISLCFVRRNNDVNEGAYVLAVPDPTDNPDTWLQDRIEGALDESYETCEVAEYDD